MAAWRPFWISDRNNLSIFDPQITPVLPTKFQVNGPFGSGDEGKIDFQDGRHGGHLGFIIHKILSIFDVQVNPMLPTNFQVNLPFGLGELAKIKKKKK